ncbi:hypothetical protein PQX77_016951 [Marasmius sp. AFHP31]|nr:hypothetical protein PQX77_016951 [Marasmius sp. AFHP31]
MAPGSKPPPPFAQKKTATPVAKKTNPPVQPADAPQQVAPSPSRPKTRASNKDRHPGQVDAPQKRRSPQEMAVERAAHKKLLEEKAEAERRAAEITAQILRENLVGDRCDSIGLSPGVADVTDKAPPTSDSDGDFEPQVDAAESDEDGDDEEEHDVMEVDDRDDLQHTRPIQGKKKMTQRERGRELRRQLEGPSSNQRKRLHSGESLEPDQRAKSNNKKPRSSKNTALKTGGITKEWQARDLPSSYQSQSSQAEDETGFGGLPTESEREDADREAQAAVLVRSGQATSVGRKSRATKQTDVVVVEKNNEDSNGTKRDRRGGGNAGNAGLPRGKRYTNQHLLLSPDELQIYQSKVLSTIITFVGTKKNIWDIVTAKEFFECLEGCYNHFFADAVKKRPSLIPIIPRSPEYIVTSQRLRTWRNKIGTTAVSEVRTFFKNWTKPTPAPKHLPPASEIAQTLPSTGNDSEPHEAIVATVPIAKEGIPDGENDLEDGKDLESEPESHDLSTVGGRADYIDEMLDKKSHLFIYNDPKNRKRAFESQLILKTFAIHYPHYLASEWDFESPQAGALALATTAVFRALDTWRSGLEGKSEEFAAGTWRQKTTMYYDKISNLSTTAWERINLAADAYIKKTGKGKQAMNWESDGAEVDAADNMPQDDDGLEIVIDSD